MQLQSFGHDHVDEAKELSDAAGWNQIKSDWHRIIAVQPDGCLGAWADGRLIGTTTFVVYGNDLAWVGMVLVHPDYRGQGIGTRMVRAAMEILDNRKIPVVGLDATESGRSLYEREGFREVLPIIRWSGTLSVRPARHVQIEPIGSGGGEAVQRFDRSIAHLDRSRLIDQFLEADEVDGFVASGADQKMKGYMFLRPGRYAWQAGPLLAEDSRTAKQLLSTAADVADGQDVIVDAVDDFGFPVLLADAGLEPARRLTRMTAPRSSQLLSDPSIVAAAGFEWG